nr:immunoglobulin heavy chain junction region [Macaca mulatta]MOV40221.1 immunoglobulin heavy chain junction region [Macaca mulatta]MOV42204.1 immunoglobulin heavy chain junction region [Macaca mulatta]MOV44016.1 immunoglobulin heavy chain junction region [Macaca mulatta]MOV45798.1 immunoglobulin heavy chain junction region [Macaca mulatta]
CARINIEWLLFDFW